MIQEHGRPVGSRVVDLSDRLCFNEGGYPRRHAAVARVRRCRDDRRFRHTRSSHDEADRKRNHCRCFGTEVTLALMFD